MVDVKNKEIINFDLVLIDQKEKSINNIETDLKSGFTRVDSKSFSLEFTDRTGRIIDSQKLSRILDVFQNIIYSHPEIEFIWNDCKSEEPCHELGLYDPVHNFFMNIFLKENVKLSIECTHALGNLKIAKHISAGEETLLTPEGFYAREELNHCAFLFKYHTSWDWLMPTWYKIRDLAQQRNILINKQIDDTFGVTIQVYKSDGYYLKFEDNRHSGIRSFWIVILKFIEWFEKEIKLSA